MEDVSKNSKYINCSKCKCKYINDEEHIYKDFGYTRLEMRYKTCVKCRASNKINDKTYYETHKEERKEYEKQYRENNSDKIRAYDRERNNIKNTLS